MNIRHFGPGESIEDAGIVREAVFVVEQKFDADNEFDGIDKNAYHVVIYNGASAPVATGRLFASDEVRDEYIIGRVAVLKGYRSTGIGRAVMLALEERAKSIGAVSIYLGAQDHATPFYEGLGYKVAGDEYMDEHTPHFPMRKVL